MLQIEESELRISSIEFFDRKGAKLKTLTYDEYQKMSERFWRAHRWTMKNHQSGKSTTIQFVSMSLQNGFTANDFSTGKLGNQATVWKGALVTSVFLAGCATVSFDASGFVAVEGKLFVQPPRYPGQETGNGVSLVTEPKFELKGKEGTHALTLQPFYRLDPTDERRSHLDVREARYRLQLEHFVFSAGMGVFNWGALEAHCVADVMNQIDFVESVDGSAKLGQPFVEAGWVGESASLKLYYLPYFRERTFPGARGRPRFGAVVDTDGDFFCAGQLRTAAGRVLLLTRRATNYAVAAMDGLTEEVPGGPDEGAPRIWGSCH